MGLRIDLIQLAPYNDLMPDIFS